MDMPLKFSRQYYNQNNLYAKDIALITQETNVQITSKQLRWPSDESVQLGSCRLGFDFEWGQTNDFKIGIHSFPA